MNSSLLTYTLAPSLPADSYSEIETLAHTLRETAPELQIDLVDGVFVSSRSWPFNLELSEEQIKEELKKLSSLTDDFKVEVDCMIVSPERFLETFMEIGITRLAIHLGSTDVISEIISHAREHGYKIGLALTNDISLSALDPYFERIDYVQLMGIAKVGKQGLPFDERTLARAKELRDMHPTLEIAVDGSVNKDTIPRLLEVGVNRFAPGSAIAKQGNPKVAYEELRALLLQEN